MTILKTKSQERLDLLVCCANDGLTTAETAELTGLTYQIVRDWATRYEIQFAGGYQRIVDLDRAAEMARLYQEESTLEQIGQRFGVTRERVRQIISKHHGLSAKDGAYAAGVRRKKEARRARLEAECQRKKGCSLAQLKEVRKVGLTMLAAGASPNVTPLSVFQQYRRNYSGRWNLTFWQWWTIWQESGHWDERGFGRDKYCLRRHDRDKPHSPDNSYVGRFEEACAAGRSRILEAAE